MTESLHQKMRNWPDHTLKNSFLIQRALFLSRTQPLTDDRRLECLWYMTIMEEEMDRRAVMRLEVVDGKLQEKLGAKD